MKNHQDTTVTAREQKLRACNEFLSATRGLKKALENGEETAVIQLIRRRDDLIRVIDELDRRMIRSPKSAFSNDRPAVTGPTEHISVTLLERLQQMVSVNQECEVLASAECDLLKNNLTGIHRKEEGLQGYSRPVQRLPKFLNIHT
jgi:hypothetical protein